MCFLFSNRGCWSFHNHFLISLQYIAGCSNQNYQKWMPIELKRCIFDLKLVKPKCVLEAVVYFWKILNKQLKIVNKFKEFEKTIASQTYFGFTNIGSNIHHFSSVYFWWFSIGAGAPCTMNNKCGTVHKSSIYSISISENY